MKDKREKRLNSEFKKQIYEVLTTEVKDDRISEIFSITSVEITDDLKEAKVYVSIFSLSPEKKRATFEAICSAAPFVRRELSRSMHIRTVPLFTFLPDNRAEYSEKIEKIIGTIKAEEADKKVLYGDADKNLSEDDIKNDRS